MRAPAAALLALTAVGVAACGYAVEVPPAHVGKLSTASGLQDGVIPPSKFRLDTWCVVCQSLVLVETSDYAIKEQMTVYMPADQLNLTVEVRGTLSVHSDPANANKVFSRVASEVVTGDPRVRIIKEGRIYETYAQPIIREAARIVIAKYSIEQVMENRDAIGAELTQFVGERLAGTPVAILQFGLSDIQPPTIIVDARIAAQKRQIEVQQAEADKQVRLKQAEGNLAVAIKQQEVDLKEAETQALVNQKLAEGVNQAFVTQRWLRVMEELATNDGNQNRIWILPFEAIANPALLMNATAGARP